MNKWLYNNNKWMYMVIAYIRIDWYMLTGRMHISEKIINEHKDW